MTVVATDDFNRASLGSDWAQLRPGYGSISIASSTVAAPASAQAPGSGQVARWVGAGTFEDDQYAKIEVAGSFAYLSTQYHVGVIVRASADTDSGRDFYYAIVCANRAGPNYTTYLGKVVNGANSTLHSADVAWTIGDVIELQAEGTTLTVLKNGTSLGGSFVQTDSSLTTGAPGMIIAGDSAYLVGDNWEGGNLDGAAASAPKRSLLLGIG